MHNHLFPVYLRRNKSLFSDRITNKITLFKSKTYKIELIIILEMPIILTTIQIQIQFFKLITIRIITFHHLFSMFHQINLLFKGNSNPHINLLNNQIVYLEEHQMFHLFIHNISLIKEHLLILHQISQIRQIIRIIQINQIHSNQEPPTVITIIVAVHQFLEFIQMIVQEQVEFQKEKYIQEV